MPFFAGRRNGGIEADNLPLPPAGGDGPGGVPPMASGEVTGLPPWVESAVKKLLASVLPQFKPLIDKTELVLADAQTTLAGLRQEQRHTQAELNSLRLAQIETMSQLAALKASVDRLALLSADPDP